MRGNTSSWESYPPEALLILPLSTVIYLIRIRPKHPVTLANPPNARFTDCPASSRDDAFPMDWGPVASASSSTSSCSGGGFPFSLSCTRGGPEWKFCQRAVRPGKCNEVAQIISSPVLKYLYLITCISDISHESSYCFSCT